MTSRNRDGADAYHRDARPLLHTVGLVKDYPGVRALDDVQFALRAGEVHVLFGENGAGKSTLISLIAGAQKPTDGEIYIRGERVAFANVHEARRLGISAVFQEFSLIPQMTVAENLFLGAEHTRYGLLRKRHLHGAAEDILRELDFRLSPDQRVDRLTRAEQQMVEIAKAFRSDLSVLILDEPTASLTDHESDQLFDLIGKLKARGVGIIYITHRLPEIFRIGDRVTVLRDGRYVDTVDAKDTSENELVRLMTGRVMGQIFPELAFDPGRVVLRVENLTIPDRSVEGVTMTVRQGEVVGCAGLVGSGKSRFAQACFGARVVDDGKVTLNEEDVTGLSPRGMLDRGLIYLPSDRRSDGLMMMRPARENMSLASLSVVPFSHRGLLDRRSELNIVNALADRLNLSPRKVERLAEHFSGGNQQKVMLARGLTRDFDLIIFDEPTVGVDVGTRSAIYELISELCGNGAAVLLVSSDLPEVLHMSNRLYVFCRGRISAELTGDDITESNALTYFFERDAA